MWPDEAGGAGFFFLFLYVVHALGKFQIDSDGRERAPTSWQASEKLAHNRADRYKRRWTVVNPES